MESQKSEICSYNLLTETGENIPIQMPMSSQTQIIQTHTMSSPDIYSIIKLQYSSGTSSYGVILNPENLTYLQQLKYPLQYSCDLYTSIVQLQFTLSQRSPYKKSQDILWILRPEIQYLYTRTVSKNSTHSFLNDLAHFPNPCIVIKIKRDINTSLFPTDSTNPLLSRKRQELEFTTQLAKHDIVFANQFEVWSNLPPIIAQFIILSQLYVQNKCNIDSQQYIFEYYRLTSQLKQKKIDTKKNPSSTYNQPFQQFGINYIPVWNPSCTKIIEFAESIIQYQYNASDIVTPIGELPQRDVIYITSTNKTATNNIIGIDLIKQLLYSPARFQPLINYERNNKSELMLDIDQLHINLTREFLHTHLFQFVQNNYTGDFGVQITHVRPISEKDHIKNNYNQRIIWGISHVFPLLQSQTILKSNYNYYGQICLLNSCSFMRVLYENKICLYNQNNVGVKKQYQIFTVADLKNRELFGDINTMPIFSANQEIHNTLFYRTMDSQKIGQNSLEILINPTFLVEQLCTCYNEKKIGETTQMYCDEFICVGFSLQFDDNNKIYLIYGETLKSFEKKQATKTMTKTQFIQQIHANSGAGGDIDPLESSVTPKITDPIDELFAEHNGTLESKTIDTTTITTTTPQNCSICLDEFTKTTHKMTQCTKCKIVFGLSCIKEYIQQYGLITINCPDCRYEWKYEDLLQIFTKKYITTDYRSHQEKFYLEREIQQLPGNINYNNITLYSHELQEFIYCIKHTYQIRMGIYTYADDIIINSDYIYNRDIHNMFIKNPYAKVYILCDCKTVVDFNQKFEYCNLKYQPFSNWNVFFTHRDKISSHHEQCILHRETTNNPSYIYNLTQLLNDDCDFQTLINEDVQKYVHETLPQYSELLGITYNTINLIETIQFVLGLQTPEIYMQILEQKIQRQHLSINSLVLTRQICQLYLIAQAFEHMFVISRTPGKNYMLIETNEKYAKLSIDSKNVIQLLLSIYECVNFIHETTNIFSLDSHIIAFLEFNSENNESDPYWGYRIKFNNYTGLLPIPKYQKYIDRMCRISGRLNWWLESHKLPIIQYIHSLVSNTWKHSYIHFLKNTHLSVIYDNNISTWHDHGLSRNINTRLKNIKPYNHNITVAIINVLKIAYYYQLILRFPRIFAKLMQTENPIYNNPDNYDIKHMNASAFYNSIQRRQFETIIEQSYDVFSNDINIKMVINHMNTIYDNEQMKTRLQPYTQSIVFFVNEFAEHYNELFIMLNNNSGGNPASIYKTSVKHTRINNMLYKNVYLQQYNQLYPLQKYAQLSRLVIPLVLDLAEVQNGEITMNGMQQYLREWLQQEESPGVIQQFRDVFRPDVGQSIDVNSKFAVLRFSQQLIKKCQNPSCDGNLTHVYSCRKCGEWSCPQCFVFIGNNDSKKSHTCKKEDLDTAKLLKQSQEVTKPCPKCNEGIQRISGCDHMWCPSCKTPFHWITGKIMQSNSNPVYWEWRRRNPNQINNNNDTDIPAGQNQCIIIVPSIFVEMIIRIFTYYPTTRGNFRSQIQYQDENIIRKKINNISAEISNNILRKNEHNTIIQIYDNVISQIYSDNEHFIIPIQTYHNIVNRNYFHESYDERSYINLNKLIIIYGIINLMNEMFIYINDIVNQNQQRRREDNGYILYVFKQQDYFTRKFNELRNEYLYPQQYPSKWMETIKDADDNVKKTAWKKEIWKIQSKLNIQTELHNILGGFRDGLGQILTELNRMIFTEQISHAFSHESKSRYKFVVGDIINDANDFLIKQLEQFEFLLNLTDEFIRSHNFKYDQKNVSIMHIFSKIVHNF